MRPMHLLLILLILAALGSQLYVEYSWEYRDAPDNVRLAVLGGGVAMLLLALLLGPRLMKRGRGAVILPLLALLLLPVLPVVHAGWERVTVEPGTSHNLTLPAGGFYRVEWCVESTSSDATVAGLAVWWAGYEYDNDSIGVWHPCSHKFVEWAPGGASLVFYAVRGRAPAVFSYNLTQYQGTAVPVSAVLHPWEKKCYNLTGQGRYFAVAYIEGHPDAWGQSEAVLRGSERSGSWSIIALGKYIFARGENITLCLENRKAVPLDVHGYVLLEPLPSEASVNLTLSPEAPEDGGGVRLALLGAGALAGLLLGLLFLARRG